MRTYFSSILAVLAVVMIGAQLSHAGPYYDAVMADDPLGYWQFEETEGLAMDSSGFDRHGTYELGVIPGVAPGVPAIGGTAADFDGATGYVQLPGTWGGEAEVTVEAWVNTAEPVIQDFQSIVVGDDPSAFVHFQMHPASVCVVYTEGGDLPIIPGPSVNPGGEWRHMAMTSKSGETKVYVDGVPISSHAAAFTNVLESSDGGVEIGRGHVGGRWLYGLVDEVAIYDTALSGDRILAHYNAGIPEPGTLVLLLSGGLVGLWIWRRRR